MDSLIKYKYSNGDDLFFHCTICKPLVGRFCGMKKLLSPGDIFDICEFHKVKNYLGTIYKLYLIKDNAIVPIVVDIIDET